MKDSTKYIIMGVGAGIIGVVSYGIGYGRGGKYAIEETKKEFEKIIDDIYMEQDRHLDEVIKPYKSLTKKMQATIDIQRRQIMEIWDCLSDEDKDKICKKNGIVC